MLFRRKIKLKNVIGNVYQYSSLLGLDTCVVVENSALRYMIDDKLHQGNNVFDARFSIFTGRLKTIDNLPIK